MQHAFSFWWWDVENDCESESEEEPTSDESDWEEPQPTAKKIKRCDTIIVEMNLKSIFENTTEAATCVRVSAPQN